MFTRKTSTLWKIFHKEYFRVILVCWRGQVEYCSWTYHDVPPSPIDLVVRYEHHPCFGHWYLFVFPLFSFYLPVIFAVKIPQEKVCMYTVKYTAQHIIEYNINLIVCFNYILENSINDYSCFLVHPSFLTPSPSICLHTCTNILGTLNWEITMWFYWFILKCTIICFPTSPFFYHTP